MGFAVPGYLCNVQLHKTIGLVLRGLQFAWKVVGKSCQFTWKLQMVSFRQWQSFKAITLDKWPAWQLDFFILLPLGTLSYCINSNVRVLFAKLEQIRNVPASINRWGVSKWSCCLQHQCRNGLEVFLWWFCIQEMQTCASVEPRAAAEKWLFWTILRLYCLLHRKS